MVINWLADNFVELFGAVTGIIYVILEIRQSAFLWPVGIITSAVYIWVFLIGKLYADMSLQVYYVVISILGWYWWVRGAVAGSHKRPQVQDASISGENPPVNIDGHPAGQLQVTRIKPRLASVLLVILMVIYAGIFLALSNLTDSPVPELDALITSLSIVGTWMLARKIYEHWFVWIIVNILMTGLCISRELYPTAGLYSVYLVMSFTGLYQWGKSRA